MANKLRHAAEIWNRDGEPTGNFAEVMRGQVQDVGGNVLYEGSADECVWERQSFRVPTQLVPTAWVTFHGDVTEANHCWQLVMEEK